MADQLPEEMLDLSVMLTKMANPEPDQEQENQKSVAELAAEADGEPESENEESDPSTSEDESGEEDLPADETSEDNEDETVEAEKPHSNKLDKRLAKLLLQKKQLEEEVASLKTPAPQVQVAQEQLNYTAFDSNVPNPQNYKNGANDIDYILDSRDYVRTEQQKHQTFVSKVAEAVSKDPELQSLLKKDKTSTSPLLEASIKNSPVGIPLLKHFLANPELTQRLVQLSPTSLAHEIGKLEAKLELAQGPTKKTGTAKANLPAPLSPVKNTKTTTVKKSSYTFY